MTDCKYCRTTPNHGETECTSEEQARRCAWMGESDWMHYSAAADKARAWDAVVAARADEREKCAKIVEDFGWTIPLYAPEAEVNAATDEVASMVTRQIAEKIRALALPQSTKRGQP